MGLYVGLCSLAGLSLFLAWLLRRSSALMPILAAALAIVFFALAGCLNVLVVAGYAWYALCFAALVFVCVKEKRKTMALFSPGLLFFVAAGVFVITLFLVTKPLLTQWDEFAIWGTAAKTTSLQNELYITARSSQVARSAPPAMMVFSYMMQFFGEFSDHGYLAAVAVLCLACLPAATAVWRGNKTGAVLFCAALFLLPVLFDEPVMGNVSRVYFTGMADIPLSLLFGGALGFYFSAGERGGRMLLPFAVILAALTCVKDIAMAFALMALFVAAVDMLFCERDRLAFFGLRRWWGWLAGCGACLLAIVFAYGGWALYLKLASGVDRFNVGSQGGSLGQMEMLVEGASQLVGINRSPKFAQVATDMLWALVERPVMLLGSGAIALGLIAVVTVLAWYFAPTPRRRRRVVVFTLAMAFCFVAFYIFNIFTYTFIFQDIESAILKDYHRYISPFWLGWMLGALTLLCTTANNTKASYVRLRVARAVCVVVCVAFTAAPVALWNWQANFLHISPSLYGTRTYVREVADAARRQGLQSSDTLYLLTQWDDATRYYNFTYELDAVCVLMFAGPRLDDAGEPLLLDGVPQYMGNQAGTLAAPGQQEYRMYQVACTPEEFVQYLRQEGCTHVLVDVVDQYILDEFAPLFSDGLAGWTNDRSFGRGHRYYRVQWQSDGSCLLVAQEGGAA